MAAGIIARGLLVGLASSGVAALVGCTRHETPAARHLARPGVVYDSEDTGIVDTGDSVFDTADSVDSGETSDSTEPDPTLTCWLGADRGWTTCEPTVAWDASWGSDYVYPPPYDGSPQYAVPVRYVDLEALDPDLEFAPNFVVNEYMASYKGRYGILQDHMTGHLQDVRDFIGGPLTLNSGYRSPGYNAGVGGVEYSRHQYGDGVDVQADGWTVEELGDVCTTLDAGYVGLYEDGHTHCDWRDDPLDPAYFGGSRAWGPGDDEPPAPRPLTDARIVEAHGRWTAPATGFDEGEPLRRWTAWNAGGELIASATGREYAPPTGTARLDVRVGGQVSATVSLPAR